jgi:hypothetical protein
MSSSGYRKFFVFLFLFAFALLVGSYVRAHWPLSPSSSQSIAGAWSVERSGSGLAVSWNFKAPQFRNASTATLEIEDGAERRKITLKRADRASTLFYTPRQSSVTLRLRIPGETGTAETIRIGPSAPAPVEAAIEVQPPVVIAEIPEEGTRARTIVPRSVWRVRAFAPYSLTSRLKDGGMDVAVYVKIAPSGKVTEASTRKYDDATETALARIATGAALQWKFNSLKGDRRGNPIDRHFVIHFKFPRT